MSKYLSYTPKIPFLLVCTFFMTSGCKIASKKLNENNGGYSSVYASIDGIKPEDKKDMGEAKYWLTCKQISLNDDFTIEGKSQKIDDKDLLVFEGKNIKEGMKCTLEVKGEAEPKEKKIKWHTEPETPGLYYASTWATVTDRKLKLKVYKLFSVIPDVPTFNATIFVKPGTIVEGQDKERNQPSATNVIGNLFCGGEQLSEIGTYAEKDDVYTVSFALSVDTMDKIASCQKLNLFNNDSKKTYEADLKDLVIKGKKGEAKELKNSKDEPFEIFWIPAQITVSACLHKLNDRNCLFELPDSSSYWLAKIALTKNLGEDVTTKTIFVSDLNFRSDDQKEITIYDIKDRLLNGKLRAYNDDFYEKLKGESKIPFDEDFLKNANEKQKQSMVDIATELDGFEIQNILDVYVHKFEKVEVVTLEKLKTAVWIATVSAKIGEEQKRVFVSGKDNYLLSKSNPIEKGFLDLSLLKQDITNNKSDRWKFYQFSKEVFVPDGCSVSFEEALNDMNGRDLSTLENAEKIADCQVEATALTSIEEFSNPEYYLWTWKEIAIK